MAIGGQTTLISKSSIGDIDNTGVTTGALSISDTGIIAFKSRGSNLVPNDTNGQEDVFTHDPKTGITTLISVSTSGTQGNGLSGGPAISPDGRWVAFYSFSDNLVPDDVNETADIFLHDRNAATTERVSILPGQDGGASFVQPGFSGDSGLLSFGSSRLDITGNGSNGRSHLFLLNLSTRELEQIPPPTPENDMSASGGGQMDANGELIVFESLADDLVDNDNNGARDVFLYDRTTAETELISINLDSVSANGSSALGSIDDGGRYVAFNSNSSDLVADDDNGEFDVFVRDRVLNITTLISRNDLGEIGDGDSASPRISGDGSSVVFESNSSNFAPVDHLPAAFHGNVYSKHLSSGTLTLVSERADRLAAGRSASGFAVSHSGRQVVFNSRAPDLIDGLIPPNDLAFLRDIGAPCDVTSSQNQYELPGNQWALLSLPCLPPAGATIEDLFADDIGTPYGSNWTIITYDTETDGFALREATDQLKPGEGFWIIQSTEQPVALTLPEGSRTVGSDFLAGEACVSTIGCQRIAIAGTASDAPRWNLVGNPFSDSSASVISTVRVTAETGACASSCTLMEAQAASLLSTSFITYSIEEGFDVLAFDASLQPWDAFWVAGLDGALNNVVELHIPK